jgi:hypothetical protein
VLRFPYSDDFDAAAATLAVADTANNRALLVGGLPDVSGAPATAVLGQPGFAQTGENPWQGLETDTFCWPYGLSVRGERLTVADSGNNRMMIRRRR